MTLLKMAWAATALWSLMVIAASERDLPEREPGTSFADRFDDGTLPLAKADRLAIAAADTEPPPQPPTVATHAPADAPAIAARHPDRRDVCARHGMRRVVRRGGRSWRCR